MHLKYIELTRLVGRLACFELPLLVQAFPDRRPPILLQLSRWVKEGKVVPLRRGIYTLPDDTRRVALDPALLAQHLCKPSYLSGLWALGFHDMIPEHVVVHTSVTTRLPARYENAYGVFEYRHIKPVCFFGNERTNAAVVALSRRGAPDELRMVSQRCACRKAVETCRQ